MEDELSNSEFLNVENQEFEDDDYSDDSDDYGYQDDSHVDVVSNLESEDEGDSEDNGLYNNDTREEADDEEDFDDDEIEENQGEPYQQRETSSDFYSSIANAFVEDGILPDSFLQQFGPVSSADDFKSLIENYIGTNINQRNAELARYLSAGMSPDDVSQYGRIMNYLDGITENDLRDEGDAGVKVRQNLIYQDYINKGFSEEKAVREVNKSFNAGTDIEDAIEAYNNNYSYYKNGYSNILHQIEQSRAAEEERQKQDLSELYDDITNGDFGFPDLQVSPETRRAVFDVIAKPVYEDSQTGEKITELQRFQRDKPREFARNVGLLYTLTNGFKNIENIASQSSSRKVRSGIRSLERVLQSNPSMSDGEPEYVSNVGNGFVDSDTRWDLDV